MRHLLFDLEFNEYETYASSRESVEYDSCDGHAFHNGDVGRWLCVPVPVYGPDRQRAAMAACSELANAQRDYDASPMFTDWSRPAHLEARLKRARLNRENYSEYGDSFVR